MADFSDSPRHFSDSPRHEKIALNLEHSVLFINMLTGMGLAVGIDYSLFILSRYREGALARA